MPDLPVSTLAGVAVVPLIVGLVEMAKGLGLPARWATPAAVLLGLCASLGYQWASGTPDPRPWADAILAGLALGLSAAGLYSGTRAAAGAK